jgi:hypothetical protein
MSDKSAAERVQAVIELTQRLALVVKEETSRVNARLPLENDPEERSRLVNAYRLELSRIKQDLSLIAAAPAGLVAALRAQTENLQRDLAAHEVALSAVKLVTEGLVHAMAEDVARQRSAGAGYGAGGTIAAPHGPTPALIDRSA